MGGGEYLVARNDANDIAALVHDGEVLLVAVEHGIEDLSEVVVRGYGLGAGLSAHHVGDVQTTHHLALTHHLGLTTSPQKDEEADQGE